MEQITGNQSLKKYFDSEFIGAYSLEPGTEPILTIDSLWYGEVTLQGGRKEDKVVVKFKEKSTPGVEEVKPMILNATNRKALKKAYGADTAEVLEGKPVQLYIDPKVRDPQDGGFTEGLRIRPFKPRVTIIRCADCGAAVTGTGKLSASDVVAKSKEAYGRELCLKCAKAEKEKMEVANEPEQE